MSEIKKKQMTEEEKDKLLELLNEGREIAENQMDTAIKSSKDALAMSHKIFVLRRSAISILAHEAYNCNDQLGISLSAYVINLVQDLNHEIAALHDPDQGEMETVEIGGNSEQH